ncbi:tRNA (adenosine(37)-N6)-dimethylallyltransferase MiaA [Azohydromonas aeria]|uniref:tRNA (adenosine(37)-N6)-dimethylallyltransferase MiaA n=1 Tax=Azohydromonas aeria TaxID=2590212 RepID=UPI0012FA9478|nr:tRNA (adenosine(37)-N6)-dimethylallyltransferase MiaA [Azohydromonas aeria]
MHDQPSPGGLPWIALAGPTASGKTALALALAGRLQRPVEIVSVDSALVYRGMDIGTAKPTAEERARVPHHLIDLIDPAESYSAARFVADAQAAMAQIRARGALPLLVGGTMLYFKALIDGLDEMPPSVPAVRAEIEARAAARGTPALHAELAQVDPATARRLAPGDTQRICRALEVHRISGRPISDFHRDKEAKAPEGLFLSLEPQSRAWLHERIGLRFRQMLDAGFLDEVARLRARGDLDIDLPSMRCVGYRQAWEALDAGLSGAALRARVLETGSAATRQLAKRQLTWLRGMPWRVTLACDAPDVLEALLRAAGLAAGTETER